VRPSRQLRQEKDGRAAAYPDVITVTSHTKKDNPAGLPFKSSSPPAAPGHPYVLTRSAGGHPFPQAAMVAEVMPGMGMGLEVSVPAEMPHDWDAHWRAAARELTSTVHGKAGKAYAVDSVLAIDVSRLGWAGRWPADPSWTTIFAQVIDECDWGPLKGIILFRSPLWDHADPAVQVLEPLCVRGDDMALLVTALLIAA
jgi:hypothetical protein